MRTQEKITFTLLFVAMGWVMLLAMPRLPGENPANGVEIFIYATLNLYAMVRVHRWIQDIHNQ